MIDRSDPQFFLSPYSKLSGRTASDSSTIGKFHVEPSLVVLKMYDGADRTAPHNSMMIVVSNIKNDEVMIRQAMMRLTTRR